MASLLLCLKDTKDVEYVFKSMEVPLHSSSSGRVYVTKKGATFNQGFYPAVFNLVWKEV